MAITRDLSPLQVTPVQEVHGEELAFQFRDLEGGNFSNKPSNACLSEMGSAAFAWKRMRETK